MNRSHRRGLIVPVLAVTAVLLAACGSEDPSAEPVDSVDDTTGDGMRSPTPIQAVGSGSSAGAGATTDRAAAPEMATDMMIAPAYIVTDYVVSPDLPPLPDNTTGYVFDASATPSADEVAELAAVLGIDGEPTQVDDGYSVSWRVGPDDGSAPSVVLWDDAMLSWNYNSAWLDQPVMGCAVAGSEPGSAGVDVVAPDEVSTPKIEASIPEDPTSDAAGSSDDATAETLLPDPGELPPVEECVTPEPPANVPTAAEAEALAADYLGALGVDVSSVTYDTWADEWSAGVTANTMYDGVVAQSWGFTFGGDAELQYAWGTAATPEPVGPYALVDLDTAVARLTDGSYGFGYGGRGDIAVMSDTGGVTEPAIASIDPAEEPPFDIREGEPLPEPMPVEPMPEPEEITVTLVDVQPDLWWVWDVDGSAWLVPAYRFIGDDGGWYTVPAVTDDFLVQSEPPTTEPPTTEPAPDTVPVDPAPVTTAPVTPDSIVQYLGLSLDEFTAAVEADGLGPVRVAEIDGEPQALTMDLRPGRVNVSVETRDGVQYVVSATIEGEDIAVEPPPTTVPTTITSPPAGVVPIIGVYEGVAFYPACGTEALEHEGVTWYTLSGIEYPTTDPEHSKLLALIGQADREESPVSSASGFAPRVAEPGPGDDVGTLVVWDDGVARFVSDSGDLDVWMVDDELVYDWVC